MTAILAALASFLSGLVQAINAYFNKQQEDQEINSGVLQQTVADETAKAKDEAIANRIDLQPTPTGKSDILSGM